MIVLGWFLYLIEMHSLRNCSQCNFCNSFVNVCLCACVCVFCECVFRARASMRMCVIVKMKVKPSRKDPKIISVVHLIEMEEHKKFQLAVFTFSPINTSCKLSPVWLLYNNESYAFWNSVRRICLMMFKNAYQNFDSHRDFIKRNRREPEFWLERLSRQMCCSSDFPRAVTLAKFSLALCLQAVLFLFSE